MKAEMVWAIKARQDEQRARELTTIGSHIREHSKGYRDGFAKGLIDGRGKIVKEIYAWGNEDCPHAGSVGGMALLHKHDCYECWETLMEIE